MKETKNMSQKLGSKGPSERATKVQAQKKKKNMDPIKVNPALTSAYLRHELETREHILLHREARKEARGGS
jgi:hypothetical protein